MVGTSSPNNVVRTDISPMANAYDRISQSTLYISGMGPLFRVDVVCSNDKGMMIPYRRQSQVINNNDQPLDKVDMEKKVLVS